MMARNTETGYKTIFRFDNLLDADTCDELYRFMVRRLAKNPTFNKETMPWHNDETFIPWEIDNYELVEKIKIHRKNVTELVSEMFNRTLYPEFTHLVLWRAGRHMFKHKDEGYEFDDHLAARKVSSVTYINDNFNGGETFVSNETGIDYQSKPIKGSTVAYLSDESNAHGVNTVENGHRVTLPIWFTDEYEKSETKRLGF